MTPVKNPSPSLLNVTPVPTTKPDLAVIKPTESILVTSSYVRVPPSVTLPLNVPVDAIIDPTVIFGVPVNPADVPVILSLAVIKLAPLVS